jgi:hypothetical protein
MVGKAAVTSLPGIKETAVGDTNRMRVERVALE